MCEALESILDCVQNPIFPSYIARNLMKILSEVHGEVSAVFVVLWVLDLSEMLKSTLI